MAKKQKQAEADSELVSGLPEDGGEIHDESMEVTEKKRKGGQKQSKDKTKVSKKKEKKKEEEEEKKNVSSDLQESEEVREVNVEENETRGKKKKKKRDRWGQIINENENIQEAHEDMDTFQERIVGAEDMERHTDEYDDKAISVGGMPYDTTEEDILSYFSECGEIGHVICMKFPDTQRFSGLAIITFKEASAALKALGFDGRHMGNRCIKIERARKEKLEKLIREPPQREGDSLSVYIGNLDWNVQKIDIKRFLKGCNIGNVRLAVDKATGKFRGFGHVDFSDEISLEKAIKMDQKELLGRPVKISYAVTKRN